ncbi:F0F1 ATP synthase subunit alpha [Candidatus Woesebacteria bacterium]|nr:MAG: F0F1 ATP synthase subunit alpha [Candidatus Woesebacteria bacterium]
MIKGFKSLGTVEESKDGVMLLSGFGSVSYGEKITCTKRGVSAMVINLGRDKVGAVLFGEVQSVSAGDTFTSTGEIMSVPASYDMVGRVLDGLAYPIDGKNTNFKKVKMMPVEKIAAGVMERQGVDTPLETGIISVDSMIPVGRGQRELVIGDRGTGKTAFTLDAIINQKDAKNRPICIYVAIGQKRSQVANIIDKLEKFHAMEYTIIISATASDSVALQYLAPYSATAIAEYFLADKKDVLIVYDDLTKHAWAYRQMSLILERPPGREAYPGDIFYLHSRLLERSCRLNDKLGGGSITSFPIVETQLGDVSAYIPTNIISITDGQIYFETDLFNSGFRPAIDPGNSVSRVGSAAQTKEMKKIAGRMRLDLAQFKELEAFAQFGSADLDEATRNKIERGRRVREILKQPQYSPLPTYLQIAVIYAANEGYFDKIDLENVLDVKYKLADYLMKEKNKDITQGVEKFFKLNSL